jgi:hypothetical protein
VPGWETSGRSLIRHPVPGGWIDAIGSYDERLKSLDIRSCGITFVPAAQPRDDAAEINARIAAAVAEEREACANLCAARPDIAAMLRGEAVAMPREMTEAMFDAAHIEYAYGYGRGLVAIYQRLIEASPYAIKEAARDE